MLELLEKMNDFYTNEIVHSKDIIIIDGKKYTLKQGSEKLIEYEETSSN